MGCASCGGNQVFSWPDQALIVNAKGTKKGVIKKSLLASKQESPVVEQRESKQLPLPFPSTNPVDGEPGPSPKPESK